MNAEYAVTLREAIRGPETGTCAVLSDLPGGAGEMPLLFGDGATVVGTVAAVGGVAVATFDMTTKQGRAAFGAFKARRVTRWTVSDDAVVVKNWAGMQPTTSSSEPVTHDDVTAWLNENGL